MFIQKMLVVFGLFMVFAMSTFADPSAVNTIPSLTGEWSTNWGGMTLTQTGSNITGQYTHDQGKLQGTLSSDGHTLTATWAESPSYGPPKDSGKAVLTFSPDGKSFKGPWGYGDDLSQGEWTGEKNAETKKMPTDVKEHRTIKAD